MNIRAKLTLTYITLLSFGVIVISAYAILSIRSFLLDEATRKFENDAKTFATSLMEGTSNADLLEKVSFVADLTGYNVALFDSMGSMLVYAPATESSFNDSREFLNEDLQKKLLGSTNQVIINERGMDKVVSFHKIGKNSSDAPVPED